MSFSIGMKLKYDGVKQFMRLMEKLNKFLIYVYELCGAYWYKFERT